MYGVTSERVISNMGWSIRCRTFTATQATARPNAAPPAGAASSVTASGPGRTAPTIAAPTAPVYSTKAVPSFVSPSPSTIVASRSGTSSRLKTDVAATASVGATTTPAITATTGGTPATSTNPPATAAVVTITSPTDSRPIGRALARRSSGAMKYAA